MGLQALDTARAGAGGSAEEKNARRYCEIWARRLSDGGVAVVMYNNDKVARQMTVHFDSLGVRAQNN